MEMKKTKKEMMENIAERIPTAWIEELLVTRNYLLTERRKLIALKFKVTSKDKLVQMWYVKEKSIISGLTTDEGKKKFTNETQREAELFKRKGDSLTYKEAKLELERAKGELEEQKLIIDDWTDYRKDMRIILNLIAER